MDITLTPITIRDLVKGYTDDGEGGVRGFDGQLDIRPPYQREFVYKDDKRNAVIDTVMKGFPLNMMYWVKKDPEALDEGEPLYEVLDGQQRTISIGQYFNNDFTIDYKGFANLPKDKQEQFLNYELMVYICEGTDSEKLEWFKTINIAGEPLTAQELRNSVYAGQWLSDAKRHFSRSGGAAYGLASDYLTGTPIRQDYLETALDWISDNNIEVYMAKHQHEKNANELWLYFQQVINWVKTLFPEENYRKEMKGVDWGSLYRDYRDNAYDADELEAQVKELMMDDEVKNKKGIYPYLFNGKEKHLNLRQFTPTQKRQAYERQNGVCPICGEKFDFRQMEGDHITPWSEGGKTDDENLQMLCKECNRRKSNK